MGRLQVFLVLLTPASYIAGLALDGSTPLSAVEGVTVTLGDQEDADAVEEQAATSELSNVTRPTIECSKETRVLDHFYVPDTVAYPETAYYPKKLDTCDPANLVVRPNPSIWLHKTKISVVVALGHKIKSIHWLEQLVERKEITVFVYYYPTNIQPELKANLEQITNPRFVKIENRFSWQHTEAYVYLVHVLVFTAELGDLNFFLQDDTCDEEYRLACGHECGGSGHTHDIVQKIINISGANPRVQFMPLSTTPLGNIPYAPVARNMGMMENILPLAFTRLFYNESQMKALKQQGEFYSWKNGLFAVSKARILRHPLAVYAAAIRLCEAKDSEHNKKHQPLSRSEVGFAFERTWQDIFGASACQFRWGGCSACPQDCGSCNMTLTAVGTDTKQRHIAC
jgi:hypothetical protein